MTKLLMGSHVSMQAPDYLVGAVNEALSYDATTFMFYTGAPQNTHRIPVEKLKSEEAHALMKQHGIDASKVVVHAPYIINLGNTTKIETYELAVSFLKKEIERVEALGFSLLVLHPGAHLKASSDVGIKQIVKGLNEVMSSSQKVMILLETMAGKGTEVGRTIEEISDIIKMADHPELLGICLDTCHLHDAGYDLNDFDALLTHIDELVGLDKVKAIHINDSKNPIGAHKDRHANIDQGYIGFELLNKIVHHPLLKDIPKILETPYIDEQPPYKEEIRRFNEG